MIYTIIYVDSADITYIKNRTVIVSIGESMAIFEPIPQEMESYFASYPRHEYSPDWAFPERPIRVTIPNSLITRAQVASAAHTGDMLDNLGQIIDAIYPAQADYIVVSEANAIIYLNFILPEHEAVLCSFPEITIEYYK